MKTFKTLDFYIQVFLLCLGVVLFVINGSVSIPIAYFLVGGWQLISCLVHSFFPGYYAARDRVLYVRILLCLLIMCLISIPFLIMYAYFVLVVTPIIAIWYCMLCHTENRLLEEKAFIHLK